MATRPAIASRNSSAHEPVNNSADSTVDAEIVTGTGRRELISANAELRGLPSIRQTDLSNIVSFEQAIQAAEDTFGALISSAELGDGFARVDKMSLVGNTFVILDIKYGDGDYSQFSIIRGITKDNRKFFITDGSTGLNEQIVELVKKYQRTGGILCNGGLRVSEYEYTDPNTQKTSPAKTFYIDAV